VNESSPGLLGRGQDPHCVVGSGEMTIADAARRNKVSETSIGKWKQQFLEAGKLGLAAGVASRPSSREEALAAEAAS